MRNKKKVDPKIKEHFAKMGRKSWEVRKAKILGISQKVSQKVDIINDNEIK